MPFGRPPPIPKPNHAGRLPQVASGRPGRRSAGGTLPSVWDMPTEGALVSHSRISGKRTSDPFRIREAAQESPFRSRDLTSIPLNVSTKRIAPSLYQTAKRT